MKLMPVILSFLILISCNRKSDIPVFNLLLTDSITVFNTAQIPKGKMTVLVFFSTDCEYCQEETVDLIKNIDAVKKMQFYYIGIDSIHKIRDFSEYYGLNKYSNIVVGKDYTLSFPGLSGLHTIPSSIVYDEQKRLKVIIKGDFKVKDFLRRLKEL